MEILGMSTDYSKQESATASTTTAGITTYWTRYEVNVPADYCALIGEICSRWSWLEFQSGVIAREVLTLDKAAGFSLTGGMSMKSASTVLKALALGKYLDKHLTLKERLGELGKKLYNLGDLRNEYAHGIWGYEKEGNPKLGLWKFKRPEDRVEPNWVNKPLTALRADADTLKALQKEAQLLTWDLKDALRNKPPVRRPL